MPKPKKIDSILSELAAFRAKGDDDMDRLEELCDELSELPDRKLAMGPLLTILEKNPNADFGAPGPVVHFLETFYKKGYEEALLASVERCPVPHTLWMLNRLINGSTGKVKSRYRAILEAISTRRDVSTKVRREARHFLQSDE